MKIKNYSSPLCEVRKSGLRASILAGSNQVVKGHDFEGEGFSARERSAAVTDESVQF
jgi:hypothetical protein